MIAKVLSRITEKRTLLPIVRRGDVRVRVHGVRLLLPRAHALPAYVRRYPGYSTNVVRVARAILEKYPNAPLIDVGANVGDTTSFWRAAVTAPILAVEGDPHWLRYLEANTGSLEHVTRAPLFLGSAAASVALRANRRDGTSAFIRDDERGVVVEVSTARNLLERFPDFRSARLVKTDTDGYDYEIVESFLAAGLAHPCVFFFEHDPHFGTDGLGASEHLRAALLRSGYGSGLWWDNFGRFLVAQDLSDERAWNCLAAYVPAPGSA